MLVEPGEFAVALIMRSIDDGRRREHAVAVVAELQLDERLTRFIPMRPSGGRRLAAYERLLETLRTVSALPEPDRSTAILQLTSLVDGES